jgi:hypothetical protein
LFHWRFVDLQARADEKRQPCYPALRRSAIKGPPAERLINGMEALIEMMRLRELLKTPDASPPCSPREAVLRYFGLPALDQILDLPGAAAALPSDVEPKTQTTSAVRLCGGAKASHWRS